MPIWHCDELVHATGKLDKEMIQYEGNVSATHRGPQVDVHIGG